MKYIKITLLLAIAASGTLHGFEPGDAASAGASTNQNTPVLPSCEEIPKGIIYQHLMRESQPTQEALTASGALQGFNPDDATSAGSLENHKQGQSQQSNAKKKYVCLACGHGTNRKWCFENHMRTHTRETPFICYLCGRRFTENSNLKRHEKAHTGKKRYGCPYCSRKSIHRFVIIKHIRARHPDKPKTVKKLKPEPRHYTSFDLMQGPREGTPLLDTEGEYRELPSDLQDLLNPEDHNPFGIATADFLDKENKNNREAL